MIQRIQSLFLLVAAGAIFAQFGLPYLSAATGNPAQTMPQLADGALNPMDNYGLLGLTLLDGLVSLAAIFLYQNRPTQSRITMGSQLLSLALLILAGVIAKLTMDNLPEGGVTTYGLGWALPIIAAITQWLAMRSIRHDEQLVRSMDRLR